MQRLKAICWCELLLLRTIEYNSCTLTGSVRLKTLNTKTASINKQCSTLVLMLAEERHMMTSDVLVSDDSCAVCIL